MKPAQAQPTRSRLTRWAMGGLASAGLVVVFVTSLVVALLVHLNLPAARRGVAALVSQSVSATIRGRLEVSAIRHLGVGGIDVERLAVRDPDGRLVLEIADLTVSIRPLALARTQTISWVAARRIDVTLIDDGAGQPTLVRAFEAKVPSTKPSSPRPHVEVRAIDFDAVAIRGALGGRALVADLALHRASVVVDPDAVRASIPSLETVVAGVENGLAAPVKIVVAADAAMKDGNDEHGGPRTDVDVSRLAIELSTGESRVHVEGSFVGGSIEGAVTAALQPDDLTRWTGQDPERIAALGSPVLTTKVTGRLDALTIEGALVTATGEAHWSARVDPTAFGAAGVVAPGGAPRFAASLGLAIQRVDPHRVEASAPEGRFDLTTQMDANVTADGLAIALRGAASAKDSPETAWLRAAVVSFSASALVEHGVHAGLRRAAAKLTVDGGRNQVVVDATLAEPVGGERLVEAAVEGELRALEDLPTIVTGGGLTGAFALHAHGTANLDRQTMRASATLDAPRIARAPVRIAGAKLEATASGAFAAPTITARVDMREATLLDGKKARPIAALRAVSVSLQAADNTLRAAASFDTDQAQHVTAAATMDRPKGANVVVRDITVGLTREAFAAILTAQKIDIGPSTIGFDRVRLASTAGGARIDGRVSRSGDPERLEVATTDLDVTQLASALALEEPAFEGTVRARASIGRSVVGGVATRTGSIEVGAKGVLELAGSEERVLPFDLTASLNVDAVHAVLAAQLQVDTLTRLRVDAETTAPHGAPRDWLAAGGKVKVVATDFDLARALALARRIAPDSVPPEAALGLSGRGGLELDASRASTAHKPTIVLDFRGKSVEVRKDAHAVEPLDFDVHFDAHPTAESDAVAVAVGVGAHLSQPDQTDAPALTLAVDTKLSNTLVASIMGGGVGRAELEALPIDVHVDVPRRPLSALPTLVRSLLPIAGTDPTEGVDDGTLEAHAAWKGALLAPAMTFDVRLDGLHLQNDRPRAVAVHLAYDGRKAHVHGAVSCSGEGEPDEATIDSDLQFVLLDVVHSTPTSGPLAWSASIDASAHALPLELIRGLREAGVSGRLEGDVHVAHVHEAGVGAPTLRARLGAKSLVLNEVAFDTLALEADVGAERATVKVGMDGGAGGSATVTGIVPLRWTGALEPALATGGAIEVTANTRALRLRAFSKFVPGLDELDGRLDTDVKVSIGAPKTAGGPWSFLPHGTATIHDGVANVTSIGTRWERIEGSVALSPEKAELTNLVLHGRGGHGTAEITAAVNLVALVPTTLHAQIVSKRFGLAADGVPIGEVTGKIVLDGHLDGKVAQITAVVDPMTVELAESNGKKPQALDEDPSIRLVQAIAAPIVPPAPSTLALELKIEIPDNAWIRRQDILVALRGGPTIVLGANPSYRGEIVLERGRIDVVGKRFDLNRSTARFNGTAEFDPQLEIEAVWHAPDDTVVTISLSGRASEPKLKFSASPSATDAQIMNLLVLGRRDAGSSSEQQNSSASAAAETTAIASAMSAAILGGQLQKFLPANVSFSVRAGANGFADARIAAGYQWKHIYFEVGYNAGPQTAAAGATSQSTTTVGAEWRFLRQWSLVTTLGSAGSTLVDVIWQFRY